MIRFACSHCDEEMEISDSMDGRKIDCVEGGSRGRVPEVEEEQPPRSRREAERPSLRQSEIAEGEPPRNRRDRDEDGPPRRRNEIAEGQPSHREPSRREMDDDDEPPPPRKKKKKRGGMRVSDLRQVAIYQKVILICILVNVLFAMSNGAFPLLGIPALALLPFLLVALAAGMVASVFIFMLALKLYSVGTGVLLGILTFFPLLGFIILLVVN